MEIWPHQFTTYGGWEGHTLLVEMLLYAMYFLKELCVYLERHNSGERVQVSMTIQHEFIHPFMHASNKSILVGALLLHKTHHEISTLNVKIPQSRFVSHTNNSNKNNPCLLCHQKKKKEIHPCT